MQLSAGAILLALGAGAPNANGVAAGVGDTGDDSPSGQAFSQFSQLLSDFGAQADGQQHAQNFNQAHLLSANANGAFAAQEIHIDPAVVIPQLPAPEHEVTPDDAKDILKQLDALLQNMGEHSNAGQDLPQQHEARHEVSHMADLDPVVVTQIKDQLQQIVKSDAPKSVGAILEALPASKESKLPALILGALLGGKMVAKAKDGEAPKQVPTTAMQNLPAQMFRPAVGEAANTTPVAPQKKKERDYVETVTVVQPMAYAQVIEVDSSNVDTAVAMDIESQPVLPPADLDQLVPPLKLDDRKVSADLPDVDLPTMAMTPTQSGAALNADAPQESSKTMSRDDLMSAIAALDSAAGVDGLTPLHAPSHVAAHATHASKPVDIVPTQGFINRAPVSEQVQVAIHQAAKDGMDRITIQLDPVDLGRVEVNLHTSKEGITQIHFMVDKAETFDSLSRDARTLERTLQEAGIKADTGSMQFNLRQQPQPQMQSGLGGQGQGQGQQNQADDEGQHSAAGAAAAIAPLTRNYLINVREGVDISA